jgi:hypothetical protein
MSESDEQSETISEWCARKRISRSTYFKWQRLGLGPATERLFNVVRITRSAGLEWEARTAELNRQEAAALERRRRVNHAARAGKAAARSARHISKRQTRARRGS